MKVLWNENYKLDKYFQSYSFGIKKDWILIDYEWELQLAQIECLYQAKILGLPRKGKVRQRYS